MAIKKNMGVVTQYWLVATIFSTLLLCGCGQDSTPEPPLEKNRLLIDGLQNIRNQKHGTALARLAKLKVIYPDDQHLAALQATEYDNIFIQKIQSGIDKGDIKAALLIIERSERIKPLSETLEKIKDELVSLNTLNEALSKLKHPGSSSVLMTAIKQARQAIKQYPKAEKILPLLNKYEKFAHKMALIEARNAKNDLAADLTIEQQRSKPDRQLIKVLTAQVEAEKIKK